MYYLHELGTFNDLVKNITNPVAVMFKDDGKAWWLLAFALILTVIGGLLLWYHVHVFSRVGGYSMATLVLFILILVLFIVLIFNDINNPILRMAIIVILEVLQYLQQLLVRMIIRYKSEMACFFLSFYGEKMNIKETRIGFKIRVLVKMFNQVFKICSEIDRKSRGS